MHQALKRAGRIFRSAPSPEAQRDQRVAAAVLDLFELDMELRGRRIGSDRKDQLGIQAGV